MQKVLISLAVVISLATAGLGYMNHTNLVKEREAKAAAESDSANSKKNLTAANAELKTTKEKLAGTSSDLATLSSENTDLKARVDKDKSTISDIQKQSADKDTLLAQQKTDMDAKDAHIAELEAKSSSAGRSSSGPSEESKKQIEEKDILIASQQAKLKEQESQLAALKEREAKRRDKVMRTGLEGRILAVNSSWNFVVISLGDRNGVVNNAEMLIKRGSQLIGKVRITSVEPSTSIADIVANSIRPGLSVQPGDTIIYSGPESDQDSK